MTSKGSVAQKWRILFQGTMPCSEPGAGTKRIFYLLDSHGTYVIVQIFRVPSVPFDRAGSVSGLRFAASPTKLKI